MVKTLHADIIENNEDQKQEVYQVSTMTALLDGVYDGDFSLGEIHEHGDFGIGTFNKLDGELIGFDGEFYRLRSDGTATPVKEEDKSPFCSITFFETEITHRVNRQLTLEELEQELDKLLPSKNVFYAIRMDGVFKKVQTRTVEVQEKPYVPMIEAVKTQPIFDFENIEGTIAGFRTPQYAHGIAVAGYHLHFIDKNRSTGGHVFDYTVENATIRISKKQYLNLRLPETEEFFKADIDRADLASDIAEAEGSPEKR
ncbi:acetolactate decarboxylase (plasmid) [Niallia taxi]|uniref:acetolactate decarboxylase n=1 Tax=Niallia taxi TaxID=2499688 RepID=UPI002934DF36|nr:acetolactate decarboxylase [Niallia taxi]MED3963057.1 acetolactate decarboxylase [Niallia taxi]WOD66070.1 acetolactate decarboxylase [Niallia taxi]